MSFSQLIDNLMKPLNVDFRGYLTEFAEYPSSKYLPMSETSKATLSRFLHDLILNTLKNREIRRTYHVLTKGKGTSVLKMILPRKQSADQTLNLSSSSIINRTFLSYNGHGEPLPLDFNTFLGFLRTRGAVCGLYPKEVEYLRMRFSRNNTEQDIITVDEFAEDITRWL
jgi:hypothetical protein